MAQAAWINVHFYDGEPEKLAHEWDMEHSSLCKYKGYFYC